MPDTPVTSPAPRSCGDCSLCCKLLSVPEFNKPGNVWCEHANQKKGGCGVYAARPDGCRRFMCNWLKEPSLGAEWKPNVCKIIVSRSGGGRGLRVSVDPDAKDAWRPEPFYSQIKEWSHAARAGTGYVAVFTGDKCFVVFPEEDLEVSYINPGSAVRAGYLETPEGRQPFAQIRYADGAVTEARGSIYSSRTS